MQLLEDRRIIAPMENRINMKTKKRRGGNEDTKESEYHEAPGDCQEGPSVPLHTENIDQCLSSHL